jgi:hypothetical protein
VSEYATVVLPGIFAARAVSIFSHLPAMSTAFHPRSAGALDVSAPSVKVECQCVSACGGRSLVLSSP